MGDRHQAGSDAAPTVSRHVRVSLVDGDGYGAVIRANGARRPRRVGGRALRFARRWSRDARAGLADARRYEAAPADRALVTARLQRYRARAARSGAVRG